MSKTIAVVATMDTKGIESDFIREELDSFGANAFLIDIGVVGDATTDVDCSKQNVALAGGSTMEAILANPTRKDASPIMIAGTVAILKQKIEAGQIQAVVGLGGTQGTSNCARIFQQLPYGFPKIILSTVASGDTSGFVDILDITMMPAVADILGLNPFSRKILSNLAGAAYGMACSQQDIKASSESKGVIGMTNLGVLTHGAMHAIELFERAGYEVITFHAVGTGGRAMERMMEEGLITAVFDYALGEIADSAYGGLRAANDERLTVASKLGLPQVVCPGGAEHLGIWVDDPNFVPDEYKDHKYVFHNPYVFVPRLNSSEILKVAETICDRLKNCPGKCSFLIPTGGVSRYSIDGGVLEDRESDKAFFDTIRNGLPETVDVQMLDHEVEDPEFVQVAVDRLLELIEE